MPPARTQAEKSDADGARASLPAWAFAIVPLSGDAPHLPGCSYEFDLVLAECFPVHYHRSALNPCRLSHLSNTVIHRGEIGGGFPLRTVSNGFSARLAATGDSERSRTSHLFSAKGTTR